MFHNKLNAILSSLSLFALAWLLILQIVPSNLLTWGLFILFSLISIISWITEIGLDERKNK